MATAYDIVIRPIITEQSMEDLDIKKYAFEVAKDANKIEIKKAVEEIFGVTVDYLLDEHDAWQPAPDPADVRDRSHASIIQVALTGIVTLAVLVFVVLWLWLGKVEWVVFPCFVPAALITYLVLNSVFFNGRGNLYVVLGLVASVFAVGYLVLLRFGMNFWQLFLILIPAEAVVYFSFNIRAKH